MANDIKLVSLLKLPAMKNALTTIIFFTFSYTLFAQTRTIQGKVSSNGKPVEFASVSIAKTNNGQTTSKNGDFIINDVTNNECELVVSLIGYKTQHYIILAGGDTVLNVSLEPNASQLNEVVVTGVTRATELRKNPIPMAVISKKEMDININNNIIDAIVQGMPGVTAVTTGPNISKPFIRGLGYNRVLSMYDGMRQEGQQWGDEHGIEMDQYGIERVEVVKGPASLIYGSDALAGVINLIPYFPRGIEGKLTGDAVIDYHTNNGMVGSSIGLGYKKHDWAYLFRASGKLAHDYQNKIEGLVYNTAFREFNMAGSIGIDKHWGYSHWAGTLYDNLQEIPDGSRDSLTRKFTKQVNEIDSDDLKNRPLVTNDELKSYAITPLHQRIQHYRLYTHNLLKLGNVGDILATFGFQESIRREYNHPTMSVQPGLYVVLNTYNYDLKYNLPELKGIETTIGINGMYQTNKSMTATDFPIPDYHLFDIGGFLFARRAYGKLEISGGVRYDHRNVSWSNFYVAKNPLTGFDEQVHVPDTVGANLQFPAYAHVFQGLSGSLGGTYSIGEHVLIKANIARGFRSPNITEIGSNGLDPGAHIVYEGNRDFKPEFTLQEDMGFIFDYKDADIAIELFNNNIENYIYQSKLYDANGQPVIVVPGNSTYKFQQSRAQLYGGEVNLRIHPDFIKWFAFNNSLAYVEGLNENKVLIQKEGNIARYLPFIPPLHFQSEIRTTFGKGIGILSKVYARVEYNHYGAQNHFYGVDNTETATPGYTVFNVGFGATVNNGTKHELFRLFFQVDNIFDVAYQSNLNRLKYFEYYTLSPNGYLGIYNIGRNISFKIIVPF